MCGGIIMVNWRKPILYFLLSMMGSPALEELKLLRAIERKSIEEIVQLQKDRLIQLLLHAWKNTEYYHEILEKCAVVVNGKVNLDKFVDIPFLTKDIIRAEGERLRAKTLPKGRKAYRSSSGGSTGQPVFFWQDNYYWDLNVGTKLYHFEVLGKELGEPEIKIWGSMEDLFKGTIGITTKIKNLLYNRKFQQCFHLPEEHVKQIIDSINRIKPKIIWSYLDGIFVVSKYINSHGLTPYRPAAIFVGASTVYPHMVQTIKKAFKAPVINFYGSRELGDVACQCEEQMGLHISSLFNKVEVINERSESVIGEEGELVITSLMNYAMPFIRYRIGDRGKLINSECPCGRNFPVLDSVAGRVIEVFINSKGDRVDSYFFVHLLGVEYNFDWLYKFQVIQENYNVIKIKMILANDATQGQIQPQLDEITKRIQVVMGDDCKVIYDFVDEIPLTKSGKHLYTICKIPEKIS